MLRTRGRKIFRDVWSRKARTVLVALNIFIGVFGVVTLVSASDLILTRLREELRPEELAMSYLFVSLPDDAEEPDNTAVMETLRSQPGVTDVMGIAFSRIFWRKPADDSFFQHGLRTFDVPLEALPLEPMQLISGAYPQPGQKQFVIEERMADAYDLAVGDDIVVRNIRNLSERTDPTAPIPEENWTISGIVVHPYNFDGDTTLYTTFEDAQSISDIVGFNAFRLRYENFSMAEQHQDALITRVQAETPYEVEFDFLQNPVKHPFVEEMEQWAATLTALSVLAMVVAGFLVVTVTSTIITEQRRQIGVMKAIGATRLDNGYMFIGIALVYGMIGLIPGVILGTLAGHQVMVATTPLMNLTVPDFSISATGVLMGVVMGLLTPLLAAAIPVYFGTRVTILEAMIDLGLSSNFGQGFITRAIRHIPGSPTIRQAVANAYQKRGRLALTGLTLTLAVGSFMGVTAVFTSLGGKIDEIYGTFNFDLAVITQKPEDFDHMAAVVNETVDGVEGVYPRFVQDVELLLVNETEPFEVVIFGFDPATDSVANRLQEGTGWESNPDREGVVLSGRMAEELGVGYGDTLTMRYEDKTMTVPVIGIDRVPSDEIFMNWRHLAEFTLPEGDPIVPRGVLIRFEKDVTGAEVDEMSADLREAFLKNGLITDYFNQVAYREEDASLITTVSLIFNIASAVMGAVGAIGLLTMLSISVYERQREIGVMRSVGASSRVIASQFLAEGLFIGLVAWVIGVPLSYGLSQALQSALPINGLGFTYPLISLLWGLIGMLIIAIFASLYPSMAAARKTVADILRYQ